MLVLMLAAATARAAPERFASRRTMLTLEVGVGTDSLLAVDTSAWLSGGTRHQFSQFVDAGFTAAVSRHLWSVICDGGGPYQYGDVDYSGLIDLRAGLLRREGRRALVTLHAGWARLTGCNPKYGIPVGLGFTVGAGTTSVLTFLEVDVVRYVTEGRRLGALGRGAVQVEGGLEFTFARTVIVVSLVWNHSIDGLRGGPDALASGSLRCGVALW